MKIQLVKRFKTTPTQYGTKTGWSIVESGKNMFADCFNCPTDWQEGDSVEVESLAEREYNGKMYYTMKLPKNSSSFTDFTKQQVAAPDLTLIKQIEILDQKVDKLTYLVKELCKIAGVTEKDNSDIPF